MNLNEYIFESAETRLRMLKDGNFKQAIFQTAQYIADALRHGRTLFVAGNGGSAADAQHFVAELSGGNFMGLQKNFSAIALTTNSSVLTSIGNDFGYEQLFVRQLEALGKPGDIFCGISTSGNSSNIIEAFLCAQRLDMITVGLLGNDGGEASPLCKYSLIVPSQNTQHIQEAHIMIIHMLCIAIHEK